MSGMRCAEGVEVWQDMRLDQHRNRHTYNGKPAQTEMGWDWLNYGARYYDPVVGRWNSVDPLAALMPSCSPYAYAFNSPLLYTDPSGMAPETIDPSRLTGSGLQALANMLATPEGRASLATFARKGETLLFSANGKTVNHTFTEEGSRAKDNLVLASSDAFMNSQGASRAYTDDSWSTQLKDASPITDISGGVALLVQIDSRLGEESATHTLMHEMEVHANQDAIRLNNIDSGINSGSLKVGSKDYTTQLRAVGNSASGDHSKLARGELQRYSNMSKSLDKAKSTTIYSKQYQYDVRIHK